MLDLGVIAVDELEVAAWLMVIVPATEFIAVMIVPEVIPVAVSRIPTTRLVKLETPVIVVEPLVRVPVKVVNVCSCISWLNPATPLFVHVPPR
jgi:hypothetical protein